MSLKTPFDATTAADSSARPHILFGSGLRAALGALLSQGERGGRRIALVTTRGKLKAAGVEDEITSTLEGAGEVVGVWRVSSHPLLEDCLALAQDVVRARPDTIVALGGGSVMDTGKIAAAWLEHADQDLTACFDDISAASARERREAYLVALPTTAGSGSEVTATATAWLEQSKTSFKGPALLPDVAVIDPELCSSLSPRQVIACGLDAMSHAVDSLCSRRTTPATAALAKASLRNLTAALLRGLESGEARGGDPQQSLGSLLAGLAIAQTGTTLIHSLSYSLTLAHGLEHGLACGLVGDALLNGKGSLSGELFERLESVLGRETADDVLRAYRLGIAAALGEATLRDYLTPDKLSSFFTVAEKSGRLQQFYRVVTEASLQEICAAPLG